MADVLTPADWPEGTRRVAQVLRTAGHAHAPVLLDGSARTALQAAQMLGVQLGQIAKSIVFRRSSDDRAVLVIASGDRRVDEKKLAALVGPIRRADADFVKASTGFSIGGVSPVGFAGPVSVVLDRELLRFDVIWAAAGHPQAVFCLLPTDLPQLTGGADWADVAQDGAP